MLLLCCQLEVISMKSIKKQIVPVLFIASILTVNTILWITAMQAAFMNNSAILTAVLGSTLLMGFFLVFFLSTRNKLAVGIFGGLENTYFWHRILAIGTTALIFIHAEFAISNFQSYQTNVVILGTAANAGELARNGFIILILVALMAKFLKYEHFRFIHRFLIIPYIYALYHSFYSSWLDLFSFNALSIWMLATSVIGWGSSLYMMFGYQNTAFHFKGDIIEKSLLNPTVVELKVKMRDKYRFKPGQFAFIKINAKGISRAPHPFSISGGNDGYVYFTIKNLGDFTKSLYESLNTPAVIKITRPYGHLTFDSKKKQVWVAGGIGVTPFLGYLRDRDDIDKTIHMYYSVNRSEEAVHLDYLDELGKREPNFEFTLFEASKRGYLAHHHIDLEDDSIVYMCGPRPMVMSLKKQIKQHKPRVQIEYEAFSFTGTLVEDLIKYVKKFLKKIKRTKQNA